MAFYIVSSFSIHALFLHFISELFGKEKDDSFHGSIGNIYQSFSVTDLYSTLEEKAVHLLYFVTKNHSFYDGNEIVNSNIPVSIIKVTETCDIDFSFPKKYNGVYGTRNVPIL